MVRQYMSYHHRHKLQTFSIFAYKVNMTEYEDSNGEDSMLTADM